MSKCNIQIMYVFLFIMFQPKSGYTIRNVLKLRFNYQAKEFKRNYWTSQNLLTNMLGCNKYHCIILLKYELLMGCWYFVQQYILMALCKTAVAPLQMHWRYCRLALSHRYLDAVEGNHPQYLFLTMSLSKLPSWWPAVICQMEAMFTTGHSYNWNI